MMAYPKKVGDFMILYTPADSPSQIADVFLGGSCTPSHLWRQDLLDALQDTTLTVFSPERSEFPSESLENPVYLHQVDWERQALQHSRTAVFWLDPAKPTSYASRIEIGVPLARHLPCIIGMNPDFPGATYIQAYAPLNAVILTYARFRTAVLQMARSLDGQHSLS